MWASVPPDFLGKSAFKNPILKSSSCSDPRNICHRRITPTGFLLRLKKQVSLVAAAALLFLLSFPSSIWQGRTSLGVRSCNEAGCWKPWSGRPARRLIPGAGAAAGLAGVGGSS